MKPDQNPSKKPQLREPERYRLPAERDSITLRRVVKGHKLYLIVGFYPDTAIVGELFVRFAKQGSTLAGFAESLCVSISVALQYGVPWAVCREKMLGTDFEPKDHNYTSFVDAIAKTVDEAIQARKGRSAVVQRLEPEEAPVEEADSISGM